MNVCSLIESSKMGLTLHPTSPYSHHSHISLTSPLIVTTHFHNPTFFPPNIYFHQLKPKTLVTKQSNFSTQKNPVSNSFATTQTHQKGSFLGPIYRYDNEIVRYSVSLLRVFASKNILFRDCKQFHCQFVKMGLDGFMQNKPVIVYCRNAEYLDDARKLFDEMPERAVHLYASLMGSYCRSERWVEFFEVFSLMVNNDMLPDKYLIPTILKACGAKKMFRTGKMVHGFAIKAEMWRDVFVGNSLIDFYSNCGNLRYSRSVFNAMQERDVVSWTALVSAYMDNGYVDAAMDIFNSMEINGVSLDLISWNALVAGLARNGEIDLALRYLEEMKCRGLKLQVSSWNGVISGCVHSGFFKEAFDLFYKMTRSLEKPNAVAVVSTLTACAGIKNVNLGRAIHGHALKYNFLKNIHVQGSLIDMYVKCGRIEYAEKVFVQAEKKSTALSNEMIAAYVNEGKIDAALKLVNLMVDGDTKPDEITYNTILSWYARNGKKHEAYEILSEMTKMGLKPNIVSYNILISGFQKYGLTREAVNLFRNIQSPDEITVSGTLAACADLNLLNLGKEIHGYVIKTDFISNIFVSSALVDMYAKCRDMRSATEIFSNTEDKNIVSWNSLIAGHIRNQQPEEGFKLFNVMLLEGVIPSLITFMILLPVCGAMKILHVGRALHGNALKRWDIELNKIPLVSALVDMYDKCGSFGDAKLVHLAQKDVD